MLGIHHDNTTMSQSRRLSQFFTNEDVALEKVKILFGYLKSIKKDPKKMFFVEPSAGGGAFVQALLDHGIRQDHIRAVEVDPDLCAQNPSYIMSNIDDGGYLSLNKDDLGLTGIPKSNIVVVGNPPYTQPRSVGRSRVISMDFLNHSMAIGDNVAFIVGTTFRRPLTQSKMDHSFSLVYDEDLPKSSFTLDGAPAKVASIFQIWSNVGQTRADDPSIHLLKDWKRLGSDASWQYVKSTDTSANLRICQWGSHATVGRMTAPRDTALKVQDNITKYNSHKASGQSLTNYDPDNSHFYIASRDPRRDYAAFEARKHLFRAIAEDRCMGQNPCLTRGDVIQIYQSALADTYSKGKFIRNA